MTRHTALSELNDRDWRIHLQEYGVPVARKGWSQRFYRVAEALTIPVGIALVLFWATWTGQ